MSQQTFSPINLFSKNWLWITGTTFRTMMCGLWSSSSVRCLLSWPCLVSTVKLTKDLLNINNACLHTCGTQDIKDSVRGQNISFIGQNIFVYCWLQYNLVVVSYQYQVGLVSSLLMVDGECWSSTRIVLHFESFEKLFWLLVWRLSTILEHEKEIFKCWKCSPFILRCQVIHMTEDNITSHEGNNTSSLVLL